MTGNLATVETFDKRWLVYSVKQDPSYCFLLWA